MKKQFLCITFSCVLLIGCSAQEKQGIKDGFTEIGHTTRDVTRATGHFFRDTTQDVISNAKEATSSGEE